MGFGLLPSKQNCPYFLSLEKEHEEASVSLQERWELVAHIFEKESLKKLCFNAKECVKCVQSVFIDGTILSYIHY
jgi:hypothetical protein